MVPQPGNAFAQQLERDRQMAHSPIHNEEEPEPMPATPVTTMSMFTGDTSGEVDSLKKGETEISAVTLKLLIQILSRGHIGKRSLTDPAVMKLVNNSLDGSPPSSSIKQTGGLGYLRSKFAGKNKKKIAPTITIDMPLSSPISLDEENAEPEGNASPNRNEGMILGNVSLSPTMAGGYGIKGKAKVVTHDSVMSMAASIHHTPPLEIANGATKTVSAFKQSESCQQLWDESAIYNIGSTDSKSETGKDALEELELAKEESSYKMTPKVHRVSRSISDHGFHYPTYENQTEEVAAVPEGVKEKLIALETNTVANTKAGRDGSNELNTDTTTTTKGGFPPTPNFPGYQVSSSLEEQLVHQIATVHHHIDTNSSAIHRQIEDCKNFIMDRIMNVQGAQPRFGDLVAQLQATHQSVEQLNARVAGLGEGQADLAHSAQVANIPLNICSNLGPVLSAEIKRVHKSLGQDLNQTQHNQGILHNKIDAIYKQIIDNQTTINAKIDIIYKQIHDNQTTLDAKIDKIDAVARQSHEHMAQVNRKLDLLAGQGLGTKVGLPATVPQDGGVQAEELIGVAVTSSSPLPNPTARTFVPSRPPPNPVLNATLTGAPPHVPQLVRKKHGHGWKVKAEGKEKEIGESWYREATR